MTMKTPQTQVVHGPHHSPENHFQAIKRLKKAMIIEEVWLKVFIIPL